MNGAVHGVATFDGEQAGEEAAGVSGPPGRATGRGGEPSADFEHAGEIQPDREQQPECQQLMNGGD